VSKFLTFQKHVYKTQLYLHGANKCLIFQHLCKMLRITELLTPRPNSMQDGHRTAAGSYWFVTVSPILNVYTLFSPQLKTYIVWQGTLVSLGRIVSLSIKINGFTKYFNTKHQQRTTTDLISMIQLVQVELTLWRRNFLLNFSTLCVWIIHEPKKGTVWNKRHFEEEKTESVQHV
jgi:hypothetical protein